MSATFEVKNFDRFQHYKDRSPPWIKLYNELLEDYEFSRLPDASRLHLILIWLLASRSDNRLPYDAQWIATRIGAHSPVALDGLAASGFLVVHQGRSKKLAKRPQEARPEREGETEREGEKNLRVVANATHPTPSFFLEFWKAYPKRDGANPRAPAEKAFNAAVKSGTDPGIIVAGARACAEKDRTKIGTPYIPQAVKWLRDRRWEDYQTGNGHGDLTPEQQQEAVRKYWFEQLDYEAEFGEWKSARTTRDDVPAAILNDWQSERSARSAA